MYLVVCGVPGADQLPGRIRREQQRGYDVCVVATLRAHDWFDAGEVEAISGHKVQSRMRRFGEPLFEPLGDLVVVSPASFNTINRIALGLADDMAVGLVCEAIGRGVPVTIEPQVGPGFAGHPAYARSVAELAAAGVTFRWPTTPPPGMSPSV